MDFLYLIISLAYTWALKDTLKENFISEVRLILDKRLGTGTEL